MTEHNRSLPRPRPIRIAETLAPDELIEATFTADDGTDWGCVLSIAGEFRRNVRLVTFH